MSTDTYVEEPGARLGNVHEHALGFKMKNWSERRQTFELAFTRGQVMNVARFYTTVCAVSKPPKTKILPMKQLRDSDNARAFRHTDRPSKTYASKLIGAGLQPVIGGWYVERKPIPVKAPTPTSASSSSPSKDKKKGKEEAATKKAENVGVITLERVHSMPTIIRNSPSPAPTFAALKARHVPNTRGYDLMSFVREEYRATLDSRGNDTARVYSLFARHSPRRIGAGSWLSITFLPSRTSSKSHNFTGYVVDITNRAEYTSVKLRNTIAEIGVTQTFLVYSPLITSIEVLKRAPTTGKKNLSYAIDRYDAIDVKSVIDQKRTKEERLTRPLWRVEGVSLADAKKAARVRNPMKQSKK